MGLAFGDACAVVGRGDGGLVFVSGSPVQGVAMAPLPEGFYLVDSGSVLALASLLRIASLGGFVERQLGGMALWYGGPGIDGVFAIGGGHSRAFHPQGVLVVCGLEPCAVLELETAVCSMASGDAGGWAILAGRTICSRCSPHIHNYACNVSMDRAHS